MSTLTVGAGEQFVTLSAAIAASADGDVIKVAAGTYTNDFAAITTNITIKGVGGMVHLVATVPPPDGKAILTINADVTLDNMEFSGAAVGDGNGAGIRYEGGNLVLDHCYFHDNQDGLLSAADPSGSITIRNSEFAHNGSGTGQTHNLYVGEIGTLTISDSYFHDAVVGHEIKSRALTMIIEDSRIGNGPSGNGSYDIDLPNGGNATIRNSVIEKGPNAQNSNFISFGEEGGVYAGSNLTVNANTVLNDHGSATLVRDVSGGTVSITNNQIFALTAPQLYSGTGSPTLSGNTVLGSEPAFDTSDPFLPVLPFQFSACFAEGTGILTGDGEIAVEHLRPGDQVVTLQNGDRLLRPISWIGQRRIDLMAHPRPDSVRPIRIIRGAFAENVPHRDLVLSPDHALYVDGVLILVRQLINGGTIHRDRTFKSVRYFHVELDAHAIVLAEGLPTESYLDTGNRGFFVNSGVPLILHPEPAVDQRRTRSCAPFRVDETTVLPIWQRLADRAWALGYREPATTVNAELHVLMQNRPLRTLYVERGCHVLALPRDTDEVRLVSRAATPAECRPWLDDNRPLGVAVRGIVIRSDNHVMEIPIDHPALCQGWWEVEPGAGRPIRWTDGDARLVLPRTFGPGVLELHLTGEMVYPRTVGSANAAIGSQRRA